MPKTTREFPQVNKYELVYALKQAELIYDEEDGFTDKLCTSVKEGVDLTDRVEKAVEELNKFYKPRPGHNRKIWATRDYSGEGKAVSLRKTVLAEFMYNLLRFGGNVKDVFVMSKDYHGSYIEMLVEFPEGKGEEFMKATGFTLREPSYLKPA